MSGTKTTGIKRAALLEIYDSHDVNLYSQLLFLREGGYQTTLFSSVKLAAQVKDYDLGQENIVVDVTGKKGLDQWKELWRIRKAILDRGIEVVIFNTAHSNPVRNFCMLPFPKKVRFYGNLHGVNKLTGSLTQKIISSRMPNYFLLIDYMLEKAKRESHPGLRFEVYYPIFHPEFPDTKIMDKDPGTIWVAVPGGLEYKRRDYLTLLEHFAQLEQKPPLRFLILGNGDYAGSDGPDFRKRVADLGLQDYFVFFTGQGFMTNETFHKYIRHSDAILPLIHPINADMEKYLENQISGSYNLAFAYRKPLLMHRYFERYEDFRENSFFYDLDGMNELLAGLSGLLAGPDARYRNPKWTLAYQAERYLRFIAG